MYPCSGCGCCCKRIDKGVEKIRETLPDFEFPYAYPNGRCEKLGENNKCIIYDERPLICNIDALIETLKLDKEQFYNKNIAACNKMMEEDNIQKSFKIQ